MDTKSRLRVISFVLFVSVFVVWAVFYMIISDYITDSTEKQITLAANQIIERLGDEFSETETLSYRLKQDAVVQALAREQSLSDYFALIGAIDADTDIDGSGFINGVILFGTDRNSYRLSGTLGNKACSILYDAVSVLPLPSHISIALDGKEYIGYADEVSPDGKIVVLTEEEKILDVVQTYDQSGSLLVAVRADGETVTANTNRADEIDGLSTVIHGGLGVTPYEISVAADENYMRASLFSFSAVAFVTAAIFAAVLLLYTGVLNRNFFRPMISVIGSIKRVQTGDASESLPHVQSAEFDDMIDKFNEMILHIETKNAETMAAEVGRQKALVFSLQKQVGAHFTVNTMGAIRAAQQQGEFDKAETLMVGLTRIFRYAHSKEEFINIWDEVEILEYYAEIMSRRYGGKITTELDFDDSLMDAYMPRMILQPIMENAVEHGFKYMDSGCVITVRAGMRGGVIRVVVSDNGCGMGGTELSVLRERLRAAPGSLDGVENIALPNIRNRLYYYYGDAAHIDISLNDGGGIVVTIEMPYSKARREARHETAF